MEQLQGSKGYKKQYNSSNKILELESGSLEKHVSHKSKEETESRETRKFRPKKQQQWDRFEGLFYKGKSSKVCHLFMYI